MSSSKDSRSRSQPSGGDFLNKQIKYLLPSRPRRIEVRLKLSAAAKTEPICSPALRALRDMVLRQGDFAGIDPVPSEVMIVDPPVGLLVRGAEITVRSLGWGKLSVVSRAPLDCRAHGCGVNALAKISGPTDLPASQCVENNCGNQSCTELDCALNVCGDQLCGDLDCQTNRAEIAISEDLQAEISHPFVRELFDFVGSSNVRAVADEILAYTAFGAVDTSLLTNEGR